MKSSKSTALSWLVLPLALFAAGCQKDAAQEAEEATAADIAAETHAEAAPVEAAPAEATPVEDAKAAEPAGPLPGTDAIIIADHATPTSAVPDFDAKAFAGRYAAGGTTLDIGADGAFVLTTDGNAVDGNWTLQPGGKTATLDPNSKGEADRQIEILSKDSVKLVGGATLARDTGGR